MTLWEAALASVLFEMPDEPWVGDAARAAQVSGGGGWVNPHSTTLPSFLFTQKVLRAVGDLG